MVDHLTGRTFPAEDIECPTCRTAGVVPGEAAPEGCERCDGSGWWRIAPPPMQGSEDRRQQPLLIPVEPRGFNDS